MQLQSVDIVVPIPPSKIYRQWQPVYEIAEAIAKHLKVPFRSDVMHKINFIESKSLSSEEKMQLTSSIVLDKRALRAYNILIVDDLYDSGRTLHEAVAALRSDPMVKDIYVLTMTKTVVSNK